MSYLDAFSSAPCNLLVCAQFLLVDVGFCLSLKVFLSHQGHFVPVQREEGRLSGSSVRPPPRGGAVGQLSPGA